MTETIRRQQQQQMRQQVLGFVGYNIHVIYFSSISEFSCECTVVVLSPLVAGTVKNIFVNEYHDGFRINWDQHNFADNEGISYHLQV